MKTFVEKFVGCNDLTELDLKYPFYDEDDDDGTCERNEVMIPHSRLGFSECPSADIDEVIKLLNDLKTAGSNRVYIADHVDHHGYYFYGVKLVEI